VEWARRILESEVLELGDKRVEESWRKETWDIYLFCATLGVQVIATGSYCTDANKRGIHR
jgi:prophage maintenance system killer protein